MKKKLNVLSRSNFFCGSIPWRSVIGIRLIPSIGLISPEFESKTKPSLLSKLSIFFSGGASLSKAFAMRSNKNIVLSLFIICEPKLLKL